ncbi:MAG: PadR family transcriptional regulator [Ilumatobacteraceae bacterium]
MSLRNALLGLLADDPASGWDLLKRFEGSLAFVWPATQSQLYTELGRMADDGLIAVGATGARNRKEYAITEAGRETLRIWLTESEPEHNRRNEAIMRVFFLWTVDPQRAIDYFEREAAGARRFVAALEEVERSSEWSGSGFARFGRIALENGLRSAAANADWAEWAVGQVERSGYPASTT